MVQAGRCRAAIGQLTTSSSCRCLTGPDADNAAGLREPAGRFGVDRVTGPGMAGAESQPGICVTSQNAEVSRQPLVVHFVLDGGDQRVSQGVRLDIHI